MRKSKKMKPGKLTGPSHKNGGIFLEAEGGEYIIKKSSVKKIGKDNLDKINKDGKLPMSKDNKKEEALKKYRKKYPKVKSLPNPRPRSRYYNESELTKEQILEKHKKRMSPKTHPKPWKKHEPGKVMEARPNVKKKAKGGSVGSSIKTYSSGGYVEGK